jgi:hypothetical protein
VLITRAAPVQLSRAECAAACESAYRLRCATVLEEGWATAADFPDGLERDEFDAEATHVLGREGDRLIAVARLVFPAPGRPLPTERDFELSVQPAGEVVDIGHAIVVKDCRSAAQILGPSRRYWGEDRYPVFLAGEEFVEYVKHFTTDR